MIRLRLTEFCKIIGEDRGAVRAVLARDHAPFDVAPAEGQKQRAYDGRDLVAWMLFKRICGLGLTQEAAGLAVRLSNAVSEYFYAAEEDRAALCLVAAVERIRRTTPFPGIIDLTHHATGGPDLVAHMLTRRDYGAEYNFANPQPGDSPRVHLGFEYFLAIPIRPAFEEARARLAPHGLDLIGPEIVETA